LQSWPGLKLISAPTDPGDTKGGGAMRPDVRGGWALPDAVLIGLAGLFVAGPMACVIFAGLAADLPDCLAIRCSGAPRQRASASEPRLPLLAILIAGLMIRAAIRPAIRPPAPSLAMLSWHYRGCRIT
jgi:thiamine transport system permease protein